MMDGPEGGTLTDESIYEAVAFRQVMGRVHGEFAEKGEWFFKTWNAETVRAPEVGPENRICGGARGAAGYRSAMLGPSSGEYWHG